MFRAAFRSLPHVCGRKATLGACCTWVVANKSHLRHDYTWCEQHQKATGATSFTSSTGARSRLRPEGDGGSLGPLVICGPSGVGKGTLIKELMKQYPSAFGFSVSTTTRGPRPGEVDGKDYHFTTKDTMQAQIDEGRFVEYAKVHSNMYGTSVAALEDVRSQGKIVILDIDVQGARQVKAKLKDANFIFLKPPSMEVLEQRLRQRGTENEDKIQIRLRNAKGELEFSEEPGFFDLVLVADEHFEKALPALKDALAAWRPHLRRLS